MKMLRCALSLAVVLIVLTGCGKKNEIWELKGTLKGEVEKAWYEQEIYAVVLFQPRTGGGMSLEIEVAGAKFYSLNWFGIYVYHDGTFAISLRHMNRGF